MEDNILWRAAQEVVIGRVEGDLGGYLFKKRLARPGGGKRGGYRTIIGYRKGNSDRVVFLHGFAKNVAETVPKAEQGVLSAAARSFVSADDEMIDALKRDRELRELEH